MNSESLNTIRIEQIHFVEKITRRGERTFRASSLSGHLIHFVVGGEVEQESNGIIQRLGSGDVVWYQPNSVVRGKIIKSPWQFYTISFESSNLPLIPAGNRVVTVAEGTEELFENLYGLWKSRAEGGMEGALKLMSCLYEVVAMCYSYEGGSEDSSNMTSSWWEIEAHYSQHISDGAPSLSELARRSGVTVKSLAKMCRNATGEAPRSRLRTVQMAHIKGLLTSTKLTVSEIAYQTGFSRVQDLSRTCKTFFGATPSQLRQGGERLNELP